MTSKMEPAKDKCEEAGYVPEENSTDLSGSSRAVARQLLEEFKREQNRERLLTRLQQLSQVAAVLSAEEARGVAAKALLDRDYRIRGEAHYFLGRTEKLEFRKLLLDGLKDQNLWVRRQAQQGLERMDQVAQQMHWALEGGRLNVELGNVRHQLQKIQTSVKEAKAPNNELETAVKAAEDAAARSQELTARLLLPSTEVTDQQLAPVHLLEHLEEYRNDEKITYLLTGAFAGALLSVVVNWVTSEQLIITRSSILFVVLLGLLTLLCLMWAYAINRRAAAIKKRILQRNFPGTDSKYGY